MAVNINWGLLGGGANVGAAFQKAYDAGRARSKETATENALAAYSANPSADALAPLAALNPTAYAALSRVESTRAETARATAGRDALATLIDQREHPGRGAPAPGQTGPNGEIVVNASPPAKPVSAADIARLDPDLLKDLDTHLSSVGEEDRKAFGHKTGIAGAVALAAKNIPVDRRQQFIDDNRPLLREGGWTDAEIDSFDPHDENLDGLAAIGVGADKWLADRRQAAGQETTRRGQDISAATQRRGQDMSAATAHEGQAVTMRGQDMAFASQAANRTAKQAPSAASITLARGKLSSLNAITKQLDRAEAALGKAKYTGPIAGRLPGGISGADDAADAAIAGLSPLVRQLTRVPGEGAMSDYESRLAQGELPNRSQTREGRKEAIDQLRALVDQTRAGYSDVLGAVGQTPPDTSGFKVIR